MSDLQAKVEKLLKRKDIGKRLKFDDGKTINEALKSEAQRLQQILIKHINAYYASYDPVQYNRTYQMRESVKVETSVKDMSMQCTLTKRLTTLPYLVEPLVSLRYSSTAVGHGRIKAFPFIVLPSMTVMGLSNRQLMSLTAQPSINFKLK